MLAPIALFVYNRPEHTRQTLEALRNNVLSGQSDLFVFSDAPKSEIHIDSVSKVRQYIRQIDGFRSIKIIERDVNFGLAKSIIEGVTSLCHQFGNVIVLEDDLVTSPYFLQYMNDALIRYCDETRVMQISGHMFDVELNCQEDVFFLPFITSWGWATWGDRWIKFDASASNYFAIKSDLYAKRRFNLDDSYPYFKMLEAQMQGKIDSWAILWNLTVFMQDGLVLYPKYSMVNNKGFDGSGVHCGVNEIPTKPLYSSEIKIFPNHICVTERYKNEVFNYLKKSNKVENKFFLLSLFNKLINKLRK